LALIGLAAYSDHDVPVRLLPFKDPLDRNATADRDRANHVRSPPLQDFRIVAKSSNVNRECRRLRQMDDKAGTSVTDMSHIQSRRIGISGRSAGGMGYLLNSAARAQARFCPSCGTGTPCQRRQANSG